MAAIIRTTLLYNTPPRPARPARGRRPARPAEPARTGRLGVSRSTFYDNFVLHSEEDDPLIPGTDVHRLRLLHISANATAAFDDEVDALVEALKRHRDRSFAQARTANPAAALKHRRQGRGSRGVDNDLEGPARP